MGQVRRVTITITDDQLDAIRRLSQEMRISRSAVIRQAIDILLAVNGGIIQRLASRRVGQHDLEVANAR